MDPTGTKLTAAQKAFANEFRKRLGGMDGMTLDKMWKVFSQGYPFEAPEPHRSERELAFKVGAWVVLEAMTTFQDEDSEERIKASICGLYDEATIFVMDRILADMRRKHSDKTHQQN